MAWRTQVQPASLRGADFLIEGHHSEVGRHLAVHEYPERDQPYSRGPEAQSERVFKITGLVIGLGYMAARDTQIVACDQPGPSLPIPPHHGNMEVVCYICA